MLAGLVAGAVALPVGAASAQTYTVDSTADTGGACTVVPTSCTLRQALLAAQGNAGADNIHFNLPGTQTPAAPAVISPASPLPDLGTEAVFLDAETEPDYAGAPVIQLDGSGAGGGVDGLHVTTTPSTNSGIQGLSITRFDANQIRADGRVSVLDSYIGVAPDGTTSYGVGTNGIQFASQNSDATNDVISGIAGHGVHVLGTSFNSTVRGSRIGTNAAGSAAIPNTTHGIQVDSGAINTIIGGNLASDTNVISGNSGDGVLVDNNAPLSTVEKNLIGTDATGLVAIANGGYGIETYADGAQIGAAGNGNLISGNASAGIKAWDGTNAQIEHNTIGRDAAGNPMGNGAAGIDLGIGSTNIAQNTIASNTNAGVTASTAATATVTGNSIVNNGDSGVEVVDGTVGVTGNPTISGNGAPQIDLGNDGFTDNDANDLDTGPNGRQNFPVISLAGTLGGTASITASLDGNPAQAGDSFTVEAYSSPTCSPPSQGDGATLVGSQTFSADGNGDINATASGPLALSPGDKVTLLATDTTTGVTSEFSRCATVQQLQAPTADLTLSLTSAPAKPKPGEPVTWTANVHNNGPGTAVAPRVTFTLPEGVDFVSASAGCTRSGVTVTCTAPDIPAGGGGSRSVTAIPRREGSYNVRATARSSTFDTTPSDAEAQNAVQARLPDPVVTKTVDVAVVSGKVLVRRRGAKTFNPLLGETEITVGSEVDARHGRVRLTSAADSKGHTQTADFYEGIFIVGQTKGKKPITELTLSEKLTCPAKKALTTGGPLAHTAAKTRHLWGNGKGRFRTRGRHAAATVRGTWWLTTDTCTTTTVKVKRGIVAVQDLVRKRTRNVKAGHSYTARAR